MQTKMKNRLFLGYKWVLIFVFLALGNNLIAQFTLNGEFRPRAEYRHGLKTLVAKNDDAAFHISQRTRLNAGFRVENLKFGLSIQDVRLWGEAPQQINNSNRLMLHQGWAEYGFSPEFSVKLGRMELVYDDARIFGNVNWSQHAKSHDLALFKYEKNFKLHAGVAFNQQYDQLLTTNYDMKSNYKTMQILWYNKKFNQLGMSILFLNNGMENVKTIQNTDIYKTVFSQTYGTHLTFDLKNIALFGSAYYSGGKDASERKLSAWYAALGLDHKLSNAVGIGAGWELLSGTSQKELTDNPDYTNRSFSPLYGTSHKFNGLMDYFYAGNHLNTVGLSDLYLNLSYQYKKINWVLTSHFFSAANDVLKIGQTSELMDKGLGTEIDLTLEYELNDFATVNAGYSQMFGTETLQTIKQTGDYKATNNWLWLMVTFKPVFIK
ncbi:MAG: hypothetical protein CVT92_05315 [Bacteroidetes bacterium HGW-Bacteroidetes-1]|jgi:hypothetical protein|nr:MAG: hypothetical protein CVT92_05315 [Bacteroidetes bacterium HGW-Bacteroidetes-1]